MSLNDEFVTVRFAVTRHLIDIGEPTCGCCPVALAIQAAGLPGQPSVWVFAFEIYIAGRPYPTPPEVRQFVDDFDANKLRGACNRIEPFTFALAVGAKAASRTPLATERAA